MVDHSTMRLGKRARRRDARMLAMEKYIAPSMPAAPESVDWASFGVTDFDVMLNDTLGCCTIAALGHAVQIWTGNTQAKMVTPPDSAILDSYERWDGYNPSDPTTDQGGVELDVLNKFRQQGFAGETLDAFAAVKLAPADLMDAIWLFGGAYIGVELPIAAQSQDVWDLSKGPNAAAGSWGGHAGFVVAYDAEGLTCITWGQLKKMTWAWFAMYCSEAYALISRAWLKLNGQTPAGLDLDALDADLKLVTA